MRRILYFQVQLSNQNPDYPRSDPNGRRAMKYDIPPFETAPTHNSLRQAVPANNIYEQLKLNIKSRDEDLRPNKLLYTDDFIIHTYPSPVTPRAGPVRPSKSKIIYNTRPSTTATKRPFVPSRTIDSNLPKSIDEEMESFKEKLMDDRLEEPG